MNFEEKKVKTLKIAQIKHEGTVKEVMKIIDKLFEWISKNNLKINGDPFAIYYTNPSKISCEEMVYEVGIPIIGNPKPDKKIQVRYMPEHSVISTLHEGKISTINKTHMNLWKYIFKNNIEVDGFPIEIYLNSPKDVYEEELLTEIQIPIKIPFEEEGDEISEEKVLNTIEITK